jgi:two-component system, cell cycle sensor histidine kinase and response regulator CckA
MSSSYPSPAEAAELDRLARLAAMVLRAPVAWFCVADGEWLTIRGSWGLDEGTPRRSPLSRTTCRHVIEGDAALVVDDAGALPYRVTLPELLEHGTGAYLGVPVASPDGVTLGSLTVADRRPRAWSEDDVETLRAVAASVTTELALRAELAARRASEERFRALIEQGTDLVTVIDATGAVRYVSPSVERVLGIDLAAAVGCSAFDFVDAEDAPGLRDQLARLLAEPSRVEPLAYRALHASGARRVFEGTARNLLDVPGVRGVVVHVTDVTERRALEGRLHEAQKLEAIGLLAGGVAHDFNNLLTVIRGNLEFVRDAVPAGSQAAVDLGEAERATARATTLVRQLLAFGRRQERRPTVLDLNAVVADAEGLVRGMVGEAVLVETVPTPALWAVRADRGQLEQVLMNLVVNARDAMRDRGDTLGTPHVLSIETENVSATPAVAERWGLPAAGDWVRVCVGDTGVGMDERTKARLFEPFFTTRPVGRGTGLGLAVVYGVIAQSGGVVHVESSPGTGSRFSVFLPRVHDAVDGDASTPSRAAGRGSGTLLLVEDEPAVRRATRRTLERAGYRVHEARHADDALELWRTLGAGAVDALVTDARMPGMNGVDLAARLRADRSDLPVLLVSGYATDALGPGAGALGIGPTRFLGKPYEAAELVELVQGLVG